MPCRDGGPPRRDLVQERLDRVTALLCELTACVETHNPDLLTAVSGLPAWWKKHQREDAARVRREEEAKKLRRRDLQARIAQMEAELEDL